MTSKPYDPIAQYNRELKAFLKEQEANCPPNLSVAQKQARSKMLIELFNEMVVDTVWDLDET